ncbi:MAG: N-formylglutamate amidohydrolase [Rhizobiales bacterium]|nr:N-formylglutamate amidohydrolase [Hyphomicrobiales bacterium]
MGQPGAIAEAGEGGVADVRNPAGRGAFVVICEHASNFIPPEFDGLGLDDHARASHIAWDPGALAVAGLLSEFLDAPLIAATVSRLVYDCNRPPESESAIVARSEVYDVPGNANLDARARAARIAGYYRPFHDAVSRCLDRRAAERRSSALVTIHTFTPVYAGRRRDIDLGILHDTDSRLADALLEGYGEHCDWVVRRNEPYGPADGVTHTLVKHGLARRQHNVMIEIRSDHVETAAQQADLARCLAARLPRALSRCAAGAGARGTS